MVIAGLRPQKWVEEGFEKILEVEATEHGYELDGAKKGGVR